MQNKIPYPTNKGQKIIIVFLFRWKYPYVSLNPFMTEVVISWSKSVDLFLYDNGIVMKGLKELQNHDGKLLCVRHKIGENTNNILNYHVSN